MDALLKELTDGQHKTWFWMEDGCREPSKFSVKMIQHAVADYYGLTVHDLVSDFRAREAVNARHVACYLAQAMTYRSHGVIARCFGRADHTWCSYSCKKIRRRIASGDPVASDIEHIRAELTRGK